MLISILNIITIRHIPSINFIVKTEVAMTTVISSRVKDKNRIFPECEIFVTGKILVFHRCLCNNMLSVTMLSVTLLYHLQRVSH